MVVVCGKICGKMFGKMCGKIEKLSDWNTNWCGSRYGPCDYDIETKRQKYKKAKMQKGNNAKRQKDKKTKRQKDI